MGYGMLLYIIVAANVLDCSNSKSSFKDHHTHRRNFGSEMGKLMGSIINVNISTPSEKTQNFTQLVMHFVNNSYKCGSEEAEKVVPQIIKMVQGIFKIPFVDYFIDTTSQEEVLKTLEECASRKIGGLPKKERKRKRTKKRHRNKVDETEWRAFFTGAFESAEPKESEHESKKTSTSNDTISFKSIIDDIIKAESVNSKEKSKDTLMKIIREIDDHLRRDKKKYKKKDPRFKSASNSKRESKDVEEANDSKSIIDIRKEMEELNNSKSKPNRESRINVEKVDDSETNRNSKKDFEETNESISETDFKKILDEANDNNKSERDSIKYAEEANDSQFDGKEIRANSEGLELKTSDEVVLNQNMEISVRMNEGEEGVN